MSAALHILGVPVRQYGLDSMDAAIAAAVGALLVLACIALLAFTRLSHR